MTAPGAVYERSRKKDRNARFSSRFGWLISRDRAVPDGRARLCPGSQGPGPATDIPLISAGGAVDCGSLADGQHSHKSFGGKPRPVSAFGRDWPMRILLLGVPYRSSPRPHGQNVPVVEGPLGNSVGAIGWP